MTRKTLFAVAMVLAMVGAPLTGAVAADSTLAVDVTQDDGEVTVSVTQNETGAGNASVLVETVDENDTYNGTGNYTADDGGEVELPAPAANVTVNVTATVDNHTATTTTELLAVEENETDDNETADNETASFGQRVSAYVHALQDDENVTRLGPHVAAFVTANNPGNAPDHAGPPAFVFGDDDTETAEDSEDDRRGPPDHAGPPEDRGDDDGDEADDGDDSADEEEGDDEDDEDTEGDDKEDDGERGPPEGAGPPDHAASN